jgi:hypothetical protein
LQEQRLYQVSQFCQSSLSDPFCSNNNKGRFLVFLICTALLCFYCVQQCLAILLELARRKHVPLDGVNDYLVLFFLRGGVFRNLAILTLVAGGAVFTFFVFHLRLALRNVTTNEYVKRRRAAAGLASAPSELQISAQRSLDDSLYSRGSWAANLAALFF